MSCKSSVLDAPFLVPRSGRSPTIVHSPSNVAIRTEGLGKCYRLYDTPRDRIKQALWGRRRPCYQSVWALRDANLELNRGETVGIIGVNGSGKSTLLQILAGTVAPTAGQAWVRGRVAALLELASGFHPDFTGRDNAFLYGTIQGLTKAQIADRFAAIAEFAGIGSFMDQPLKTYSSGMLLRLAFSTAIHVDPDILLIDEALAVGDIRFQQRCLDRLRQLQSQGVSILLVTHDLQTAKRLCQRLYILDQGQVIQSGPADTVANWYLSHLAKSPWSGVRGPLPNQGVSTGDVATDNGQRTTDDYPSFRHGDGQARIIDVALLTLDGQPVKAALLDGVYRIRIAAEFDADVPAPIIGFYLRDRLGTDIIGVNTHQENAHLPSMRPGDRAIVDFLLPLRLRPGPYTISPGVAYDQEQLRYLDWIDHARVFEVVDPQPGRTVFGLTHPEVRIESHMQRHGVDAEDNR